MKTSALFQQALSDVPNDLKIQIDLSFAISDKLAGILEERGNVAERVCPNGGQDRNRSVKMARRHS